MPDEILENLTESVATLTRSVQDMRDGLVDRETVENVVTELLERQQAADTELNRRSYKPEDTPGDQSEVPAVYQGRDRFDQMQVRNAKKVAAALHRPEGDVLAFQRAADATHIISTFLGVDPRETQYYQEELAPLARALDTQTTAEGLEFVPKALSASLIERVALELRVAALFPNIQMPTQPFDIPARAVSRTRTGKASEQTADTGQTGFKKITPATRKVTLTAVKFAGEMLVSKETEEDSIIAMLPFMEEELVDYLSADIEDCTINGDTAGTHQDSDVTAADDPRKSYNGLRKALIAGGKSDASNAALSVAMLRTNRKNMGKYGITVANLAHIVSMSGYIQLLADTAVMTLEKYGPQATILTGELGKADGVPIVVSEYVRTDLNASGVQDGVTTNRSLALTVHQRGFVFGERRGMTTQLLRELYAEYDQDAILATLRKAFSARFPTATEKVVSATYNLQS